MTLRNGTYIREPDGATLLYFSPYSFIDAAISFRNRHIFDDSWMRASETEEDLLHNLVTLSPGENVFIRGGKVI